MYVGVVPSPPNNEAPTVWPRPRCLSQVAKRDRTRIPEPARPSGLTMLPYTTRLTSFILAFRRWLRVAAALTLRFVPAVGVAGRA